MNDHPVTPAATPPPDDAELQRRFGGKWEITLESTLGVWSGTRQLQAPPLEL